MSTVRIPRGETETIGSALVDVEYSTSMVLVGHDIVGGKSTTQSLTYSMYLKPLGHKHYPRRHRDLLIIVEALV